MNPFLYERAMDPGAALNAVAGTPGAKFLAGGTNLVDLMKNGVEQPAKLVDIQRLALASIEETEGGGVRIGAVAHNADTANHPLIRKRYPLLAQAILAGASPQLRNLATNGGNLLQRTRCPYFTDTGFPHCNKRTPGSGCAAIEGYNRNLAILGTSAECIASHPSDMCVALAALEARIEMRGPGGERSMAIADFHRLPGTTPEMDTNLREGELIVAINLPESPYAAHSHYLKIRDRASYDFALVSVAAALDFEGSRIRSARIALGGVAPKPWRVPEAEEMLAGKPLEPQSFEAAARRIVQGARAYRQNGFKIGLAQQAIVAALSTAAGLGAGGLG